ncbi:MAG: adenosine deaminase [Gammaproteobacteria bacterium]|jgi:adenosine deaminase
MRELKTLPKAHLHLHLEGAMRPATLDELCERYGIERPADTRGRRFPHFGGFNTLYHAACDCIRTREDLARVILEVAEDAATHGAFWIEPAFDADRFCESREGSPHRLFESQEQGWLFALGAAEKASRQTGVGIGFMSAIDRTRPLEQGLERVRATVALVRSNQHLIENGRLGGEGRYPGIVSLGLHGNEQGHPPEPFEDLYRLVDDTDLLKTPHAGEIAPAPGGGAASVRGALEKLGAHRILHGVLAIEDPALVERLARENICLDVCPSSNVLLSVFPSLEEHPLPQLLEAGVPCNIGSDDPLLFGPSLLDEFELCREKMSLSDDQLAKLAQTSFQFSGAPQGLKDAGVAAVQAWLNG